MKVAIDSGPLSGGHSVRGIGVMTRELIDALKKYSGRRIRIDAGDFGSMDLSTYDVLHYPYFHPYFLNLPSAYPTKSVVTIHDLIYLLYPDHYPPGIRGRVFFELQKRRARNADAILTITETSKKDIVRLLGVQPDKVHVVYLAAKKIFKPIKSKDRKKRVADKYGLPKKFVLYVGDVNYNKNVITLARACEKIRVKLVIVGKQAAKIEEMDLSHPELAHLEDLYRLVVGNKDVLRLGFVPDEDLRAIYNLATAYCQPSLYEGFGLPILEAMASGCPVVASRTHALVEIGGEACYYADPHDALDVSNKITDTMKPKNRQKLVSLGKKRSKEFSWRKVSEETVEVYRQCMKNE